MSTVDIIVVTFNSPEVAVPCVQSILQDYDGTDFFHIYVVNNGHSEHVAFFPQHPAVTFLQQESNLGWEGGLKAGLKFSTAPYVVFMNDDTFVPQSSSGWIRKMLAHFDDAAVGAVGPSSNFVMGLQQIFVNAPAVISARLLIGLCMMLRRSDLDAVGGVDDSLPGGDDFDLSIRLGQAGKKLIIDRRVFIYHHGQVTGRKVHKGDWDSIDHQYRVRFALINKHGLRPYLDIWKAPTAVAA